MKRITDLYSSLKFTQTTITISLVEKWFSNWSKTVDYLHSSTADARYFQLYINHGTDALSSKYFIITSNHPPKLKLIYNDTIIWFHTPLNFFACKGNTSQNHPQIACSKPYIRWSIPSWHNLETFYPHWGGETIYNLIYT